MKKALLKTLLVFAVLFVSCFEIQVKPREVNAQSKQTSMVTYQYSESIINGMVYGLWVTDYHGSQGTYGSSMFVVNLTKDALEVELLQAQVDELRRKQKSK